MRRQPLLTGLAGPAGAVNLTDDPAALQRSRLGNAYELVAEHTTKAHVALDQLQVGLAHTGPDHPDQHFSSRWCRRRAVGGYVDVIVQNNCAHVMSLYQRAGSTAQRHN